MKLVENIQNILLKGNVSQNFELGPGSIFMTQNVKKNRGKIPLQSST